MGSTSWPFNAEGPVLSKMLDGVCHGIMVKNRRLLTIPCVFTFSFHPPKKKNRVLLMLSSPLYSLSAGTIPFCVHPHVTLRRRTLLTSPARKPVLGLRTLWMSLELESFFSSVSSGFTWCSYVFGIVFIICSRLEDVCVCVFPSFWWLSQFKSPCATKCCRQRGIKPCASFASEVDAPDLGWSLAHWHVIDRCHLKLHMVYQWNPMESWGGRV